MPNLSFGLKDLISYGVSACKSPMQCETHTQLYWKRFLQLWE